MSTSSYILRASDEELTRLGPTKLIRMLKDCEEDRLTELSRRNEMMKDFNSKLQHNLLELRHLKELNFQLQKENQELRDDCCSLYEDHMNDKNFVKEWQMLKFTSDKMKGEMLNYQQKLNELEGRQNSLAKENTDLKELCVYLDQERLDQRGSADGSSNSEKDEKATDENGDCFSSGSHTNTVYEQAFTYIKQLEDYIDKLENSRHNNFGSIRPEKPPEYSAHFADRAKRYFPSPNRSETSPSSSSYYDRENDRLKPEKPKAVTNAVKVMELHQQMSKSNGKTTSSRSTTPLFNQSDDELDEKEKALVREMCNVVMRKLNDTPTSIKAPKSSILL